MKEFSIHEYLKTRPLSPSAMSSFAWDKEQWYESYILGKKQTSKEMDFGNVVDRKIQDDKNFIPSLPRYPHMQWEGNVIYKGIPLIGKADGVDFDKFILADYKTGKKKWDKKRADGTIQLSFYLLLILINNQIPPENFKCFIHWIPTVESGDFSIQFRDNPITPETFETSRTTSQIQNFGELILKTVNEMDKYVKNRQGSIMV